MSYPTLQEIPSRQYTVNTFGGYNHNRKIAFGGDNGVGQWYDIENLSTDAYPLITPRKPRKKEFDTLGKVTGLIDKDGLCWTEGPRIHYSGKTLDMGLTNEKKQLCSMGGYIIILPDKKWLNTITDEWGEIENEKSAAGATICLSTMDGEKMEGYAIGAEEPEEPTNGMYWLDTSGEKHSLKQYSSVSYMWVDILTTYVRIDAPGIGAGFSQYDGVSISGVAELGESGIIYSCAEDWIVLVGLVDQERTISGNVTVSRKMPKMDYICESNNRLFGCYYGKTGEQMVNEIYVCKLGDFRNWNCYMGISTDSYTVSIGSDGPWTGAITYGGYPCFFKERMLHKVYGQMPSNFQIQSAACRGVQPGSADSMAIVNEVLYYLGTNGVCAYNGSIPHEISDVLGEEKYHSGIACCYGSKYYIKAANQNEEPVILCYDAAKGIWVKENDIGLQHICCSARSLYGSADYAVYSLSGADEAEEEEFAWFAESAIIAPDVMDAQTLSKIDIRLMVPAGKTVWVEVQYDSLPQWYQIASFRSTNNKAFTYPVKPRRCDHLRLRLHGDGYCVIYGLSIKVDAGGEQTGSDGATLNF